MGSDMLIIYHFRVFCGGGTSWEERKSEPTASAHPWGAYITADGAMWLGGARGVAAGVVTVSCLRVDEVFDVFAVLSTFSGSETGSSPTEKVNR